MALQQALCDKSGDLYWRKCGAAYVTPFIGGVANHKRSGELYETPTKTVQLELWGDWKAGRSKQGTRHWGDEGDKRTVSKRQCYGFEYPGPADKKSFICDVRTPVSGVVGTWHSLMNKEAESQLKVVAKR